MGNINDRWSVSFSLGPFSKEFGSVTVRASTPQQAIERFKEIVSAEAVDITLMEKINGS